MSDNSIKVPADKLAVFVSRLFQDTGCSEPDAATMAQCLVQSNLWGIDSHGVLRTSKYLDRLRSGGMNARPEIRVK